MPLDKTEALKLRQNKGLTYKQIGAIQGVTKQAIHQALRDLIPTSDQSTYIQQFKKIEADITALKRADALSLVDSDTLKRWRDKFPAAFVLWYNSTYNNERLERGQATDIQDVRVLKVDLDLALDRYLELKQVQGGAGGVDPN